MEAENPKEKKKKIDDWEVDSAVDSLLRAEEIKANKELMKLVGPRMQKKVDAIMGVKKSLRSLDDLKAARDEMSKENEDD